MIQDETVFILGAGASIPFGFPSGKTLVDRIIKGSHDDHSDFGQLFPRNLRLEFSKALDLSFAPSIDDFLEKQPKFMEVGKAAICSQLIINEQPDFITRKTKGNWYDLIWGCMLAKKTDYGKNKISFITFNYDRSLEFFFKRSLINYFDVSKKEASKLLENIPIIHVHGTLGEFTEGQPNYRDYNPNLTKQIIQTSAKMIHLFHDSSPNAKDVKTKAKQLFNKAKSICLLGFGYHPVNIERIRVDEFIYKASMFGSTYGMGEAEMRAVRSMLGGDRITLGESNQDCLEFLRQNFIPK